MPQPSTDTPPWVPQPGICTDAQIVKVIDGDTIKCKITREFNVRLKDIDCPELNTPEGQALQRFVSTLLQDANGNWKPVVVFIPTYQEDLIDFTSFNRVVGDVWIDNNTNLADDIQNHMDDFRVKHN